MVKSHISSRHQKIISRLDIIFIWATAVLISGLLALYFYNAQGGVEPGGSGYIVGRDFVNIYTAGELLRDDRMSVLFSESEYFENIQRKFGEDYPIHNWSYPPTMFWPASVAVLFDYYVALSLWHIFGIFLLTFALHTLGLRWWWSFLVAFSPAGGLNILAGQNGYFTASLIVFAFSYAQTSYIKSGVSWAALTVKPHLGIVALPYLFINRKWFVIFAGAVALVLLLAVTVAVWGVYPWVSFLNYTTKQQATVLENWGGMIYYVVPTGFMQGRLWGLDNGGAYALHLIYVAVALWLVIRAWPSREVDVRTALTWFVCATFMILPYSFVYDLVILQVILTLWLSEPEKLFQLRPMAARLMMVYAWLLPLLGIILAALTAIQLTPIVLGWILNSLAKQKNAKLAQNGLP